MMKPAGRKKDRGLREPDRLMIRGPAINSYYPVNETQHSSTDGILLCRALELVKLCQNCLFIKLILWNGRASYTS